MEPSNLIVLHSPAITLLFFVFFGLLALGFYAGAFRMTIRHLRREVNLKRRDDAIAAVGLAAVGGVVTFLLFSIPRSSGVDVIAVYPDRIELRYCWKTVSLKDSEIESVHILVKQVRGGRRTGRKTRQVVVLRAQGGEFRMSCPYHDEPTRAQLEQFYSEVVARIARLVGSAGTPADRFGLR
ncbi:MAG TPA: hypothetical protein VGN72_22900 [Tepidisphaeraceae bacterium]|jgi:hypothetical protein|nr:hypothetical protein [Tepidisphaeraceae bacterium]